MTYRVAAPLVLARDQRGATHHVYQNGLIDWLDDDQKAHFLDLGLVEEIDDESDPDGGKPPHTAKKDVLVDWIVANVAKSEGVDYTEDELNELTKAQLQEIIDSVE